jgi:hypothetical protein
MIGRLREYVLRRRWAKVLDAYDWDRCARVFARHGWGWMGLGPMLRVPVLTRAAYWVFAACLLSCAAEPDSATCEPIDVTEVEQHSLGTTCLQFEQSLMERFALVDTGLPDGCHVQRDRADDCSVHTMVQCTTDELDYLSRTTLIATLTAARDGSLGVSVRRYWVRSVGGQQICEGSWMAVLR